QEERAVEVAGSAGAAEGDSLAQVFDPVGVFVEGAILSRLEPAGGEAVHRDAVLAPVVGEAHRELLHAAAARAVRGEARVAGDARYGTNVDDPARAARDHAPGHRLGNKERATEVGVEDCVPVVPCNVGGRLANIAAGVVDKNINLAKLLEGLG